jgi:hypothetical protein
MFDSLITDTIDSLNNSMYVQRTAYIPFTVEYPNNSGIVPPTHLTQARDYGLYWNTIKNVTNFDYVGIPDNAIPLSMPYLNYLNKVYAWQEDNDNIFFDAYSHFLLSPNRRIKEWMNRNAYAKPYLGISDNMGININDMNNHYENCLVNIYKTDYTSIIIDNNNSYNIKNIIYKPIAQRILITDIETTLTPITDLIFNGDCYIQRLYFKQLSCTTSNTLRYGDNKIVGDGYDNDGAFSVYDDAIDNDNYAVMFNHGVNIGFIVSSKHNFAMRHNEGSEKNYWPYASPVGKEYLVGT